MIAIFLIKKPFLKRVIGGSSKIIFDFSWFLLY